MVIVVGGNLKPFGPDAYVVNLIYCCNKNRCVVLIRVAVSMSCHVATSVS
jgi:hypothetical protein